MSSLLNLELQSTRLRSLYLSIQDFYGSSKNELVNLEDPDACEALSTALALRAAVLRAGSELAERLS
jgi:hypothetical protein